MDLPSSSRAQFGMEIEKHEMNSTEKEPLKEVSVPDPAVKRKSKKSDLLKNIGWKKAKGQKTVQAEEGTIKITEKTENDGKGIPSIDRDEKGTAVPSKDVEMPRNKDSEKDNLNNEAGNNKNAKKKRFWTKQLKFKTAKTSKKVEQEGDRSITTVTGTQGRGNDIEVSPSLSARGTKNVATKKKLETSRDVESSVHTLIPAPSMKRKGDKQSLLTKIRLKRRNSYKKAEKEASPRVTSGRRCKRIGNYFVDALTVSSNKNVNVAPTMIGDPSRVESAMDTFTPKPAKEQKGNKKSWLKKLRMKRKPSSSKGEKQVVPRMTSEAEGNETGTDVRDCTPVCGNIPPKKKDKPSRNMDFRTDELIPAPDNKEKSRERGFASLKGFELGVGLTTGSDNKAFSKAAQGDVIVSCISENQEGKLTSIESQRKLEKRIKREGQARRKLLREEKRETVKSLPRTLTPSKISVDGNKGELYFALKETLSSSNVLGLQQAREVHALYNEWSDVRRVWIAPEIQSFLSKMSLFGKCVHINLTTFRDIETMPFYSQSLSHQRSINQGQSNSVNCQELRRELATNTFWNFLWVIMDQLYTGRVVSTTEHVRDGIDIFQNLQKAICHPSSTCADAKSPSFRVYKYSSTAMKGEDCSKYVIHLQKQKPLPGDCDCTAMTGQVCNISPNTLRPNIKCKKMFMHAINTEDFGCIMWNTLKEEILPPILILSNASRTMDPVKSPKYETFELPSASTTCSIADTTNRADVIQEEANFSRRSISTPSKSVPTNKTIENLLLNAHVEYLEKQGSSLAESVNALKQENEEMKSAKNKLEAENKNIMTLLQGMLDYDGAKGIYCKEQFALISHRNGSKTSILEEAISGERANNMSNDNKGKYGQPSKDQCHAEASETKNSYSSVEKNENVRERLPDFVGFHTDKAAKSNTTFIHTIAGVITPTKLMTEAFCTEGTTFLTPEENSLSTVSLNEAETMSDDRPKEMMDDVGGMICKDLTFLNKNLDTNIAPILTKIKIYYSLFATPKKQNGSSKPLKTTLRNEFEIFKKHSEYMFEVCHIIEDLLQDNETCEVQGKSPLHCSGNEKGRSSKKVLTMHEDRIHKRDCKLGTTGEVGRFPSRNRSIRRTRGGQPISNTECRGTSGKSSYAANFKGKLHVNSGKSLNSHATTTDQTIPRKITSHSENCLGVYPLTENGTFEGIRTYPSRVFRRSKKIAKRGSSQTILN